MTLVILLLVLILIAGLPTWDYSRTWGYYPSGAVFLLVLVLLFLLVRGG